MAAADAGQHGRDMPVADLERLAELTVAPGDARQPPLEGGDRKLGAAPLDLRREVEPDRLGIGRRLGEALAAQPGGEHFPVGGVGAPGVVGLRRAGVGLGGLRQAGQPAAEPAGRARAGQGAEAAPLPTPLAASGASHLGRCPGSALQAPSRARNSGRFRVGHGRRSLARIMSDNAMLSDIPTPRQAGRILAQIAVTKRRRRFTMPT